MSDDTPIQWRIPYKRRLSRAAAQAKRDAEAADLIGQIKQLQADLKTLQAAPLLRTETAYRPIRKGDNKAKAVPVFMPMHYTRSPWLDLVERGTFPSSLADTIKPLTST